MNYVRDANTPKDIRYFEHLLMMPGALLTRGILLLRILRDNDSDDWAVQCPAFGIPSTNDKPTPVFVIHDSKYSIWEPLVLYAGTDKAITSFDSTDLYGKLGQSSSAAIHKWILEIKKKGVGCGRLQTPPYTWSSAPATEASSIPTISDILKHCRSTSVEPRGIVRERSNRFVGFIFENKENRRFFIPARDDGTSTHQWPRFYESKALLPAPSLGEIQTFYNDNKFFSLDALQIVKILISSEEQPAKYVAILLKCGVILPIDPTQDSAGFDVQPVTDFPWDLDEQLSPLPVEKNSSSTVETEEGFINEVYQYLRLILANHFKRDTEGARVLIQLKALRDARNLPLYERRKRVDTILYSVVYQFIKETPYTETLKDLPRIRKNIGSPNMKLEDCPPGIASWTDSRCMLHVPSTANITARLTDEILRNPWAFAEIDEKRVSRVRPLSGTVETPTEIITTDTFSIDSQVGKIHKTKYTQGLQFAEEQPTTMEMLKAVLGGQVDESSSLVQSMTRLEGKAYHLDLPLSFKERYKKFSVVSNAQADKLVLGLVYLFSTFQQKQNPTIDSIYAQVKAKQEKIRVPADIIAGGWRSSPYDFFALALIANCRLALITTSVTGSVVVNSYFNPKGNNKEHIILLWGDGPDLVIDLEGKATHHVNTLPTDLAKQMEQMDIAGTSIKEIDQLQVPIESTNPSFTSATVSIAPPAEPIEPVALQVSEERPAVDETVSIAPPPETPVSLQVSEERPAVDETVSIAPPISPMGEPAETQAILPPSESVASPMPPIEASAELPDEEFSIQQPEIPAPAPPVEESQQEPAVAFAGVVNDTEGAEAEGAEAEGAEEAGAEAEAEAEESKTESVKIDLPESKNEVGDEEAQEEVQEEAPVEENQEEENQENQEEEGQKVQEAEEWDEEVNQIQAAQPTLPQQPPSEQQISRPPPPAS